MSDDRAIKMGPAPDAVWEAEYEIDRWEKELGNAWPLRPKLVSQKSISKVILRLHTRRLLRSILFY